MCVVWVHDRIWQVEGERMIVPWSCGLEMCEIDWLWLYCKDELNTGVMGNKKLPPYTDRFPHPPPPTISSQLISDTFCPLSYSTPQKPFLTSTQSSLLLPLHLLQPNLLHPLFHIPTLLLIPQFLHINSSLASNHRILKFTSSFLRANCSSHCNSQCDNGRGHTHDGTV